MFPPIDRVADVEPTVVTRQIPGAEKVGRFLQDVVMKGADIFNVATIQMSDTAKGKRTDTAPTTSKRELQESPTRVESSHKKTRLVLKAPQIGRSTSEGSAIDGPSTRTRSRGDKVAVDNAIITTAGMTPRPSVPQPPPPVHPFIFHSPIARNVPECGVTFENLARYEEILRSPSRSFVTIQTAIAQLKAARLREQATLDSMASIIKSRRRIMQVLINTIKQEEAKLGEHYDGMEVEKNG